MFTYQNAMNSPNPEVLVRHALPWVLEAGNPYYHVLFGGISSTAAILDTWMRRPSSEVSVSRVQFLLHDSEYGGGFLALGGEELRKARKADAVALLDAFHGEDRTALLKRMDNLSNLFLPVADDEYYLSKLGVNLQFRGRKWGKLLVDRYLDQGRACGHRRFRLDVQVENEAAIRCYRSAGFHICQQTESKDGTLAYYSMIYERLKV
jgi:ribosomal protein S18 acetylase RimI-like enzyme